MALREEIWKVKGKKIKYYVVRNKKGQFETKAAKKRLNVSKDRAEQIYKENKTLKRKKGQQIRREEEIRTNFREISETLPITATKEGLKRKKPLSTPRKGEIKQYMISGQLGKREIVARSPALDKDWVEDAQDAKNQAWDSFLERLSEATGGEYDADEGLTKIDKVKGLREGWVYYARKK